MASPPCTQEHCSAVSAYINQNCKDNGWALNHLVVVCDFNTGLCCSCTCSCLAFGTPVAVPDGTKAIQAFAVGDPVLAADTDFNWTATPVEFSGGTSANSVQPQMIYVTYGDPAQTIVVTLDHTFLQQDGKMIRAYMLGIDDTLVDPNGAPVNVSKVEMKGYTGGVWNIATSRDKPTGLDGHLINTQGVVSGDYALQLFYDDLMGQGLTADAREDTVGTDGHRAASGLPPRQSLPEKSLSALLESGSARHWSNPNLHFHVDHSFVVAAPSTHQGYLTAAQAAEVRDKAPTRTFAEARHVPELTRWAFSAFAGFYPDVNFVLDWPNANANIFSLVLDGQKNVLVQGGLLRAKAIDWEAITLLMAYSINRFGEEPPTGADGMRCKPQCDYGTISVLMNVFYPLYPNVIFNAVNEMDALFKDIESKDDLASGECNTTTLDCRLQTYRDAMSMLPLPECASGPVPVEPPTT